jgi:2-polyprenyl-3-methyl-5-hydroxy-6-metoxy-1,4-benzoquinol methylase
LKREYYQEYQKLERTHWWFKARQEILQTIIENKIDNSGNLKILNVGASTGYSSIWLEKYGEVMSVEYDKECFEYVKSTLEIDIVNASIEDLPFEEDQFDLVCAFDVIEHVDNDQLGVEEMFRVCRPNGHVFVSVPAFNFMWSQHDDINHHKRRYTMKPLKKLFKNQTVVSKSYFNFFWFLPISIVRVISSFIFKMIGKKTDPKSDFNVKSGQSITDKILYSVFRFEKRLIKRGLKFPFGVSLFLLATKKHS